MFGSRKGPSGAWDSTSATILSLKAPVSAVGGAKHKGLTPFSIVVNVKSARVLNMGAVAVIARDRRFL
jgi:hypothetical protein